MTIEDENQGSRDYNYNSYNVEFCDISEMRRLQVCNAVSKIFFFFKLFFFFFFLDECTFTLFEQLNQIGIFILILTMQGFPGSNPGEKLEQPIAR